MISRGTAVPLAVTAVLGATAAGLFALPGLGTHNTASDRPGARFVTVDSLHEPQDSGLTVPVDDGDAPAGDRRLSAAGADLTQPVRSASATAMSTPGASGGTAAPVSPLAPGTDGATSSPAGAPTAPNPSPQSPPPPLPAGAPAPAPTPAPVPVTPTPPAPEPTSSPTPTTSPTPTPTPTPSPTTDPTQGRRGRHGSGSLKPGDEDTLQP